MLPSFNRAYVRLLAAVVAASIASAVFQRLQSGHWWPAGYAASLALPVLLFPAGVYFMFAPRQLAWSSKEFRLQPRFGRTERVLPWTELVAYGQGNNVFLLQFRGQPAFQILSSAFAPAQWRGLTAYLAASHPDKRARLWFGPYAMGTRPV